MDNETPRRGGLFASRGRRPRATRKLIDVVRDDFRRFAALAVRFVQVTQSITRSIARKLCLRSFAIVLRQSSSFATVVSGDDYPTKCSW